LLRVISKLVLPRDAMR